MTRKRRVADELSGASEHLYYEWAMFGTLARALTSGVFGAGPLHNAVLESFTVHGRVLFDFLFDQKPRPDDVVAEDYFADPADWVRLRGDIPLQLKQLDSRVGKEVAHLTYARLDVTPEQKEWHFLEIMASMEKLLLVFVKNVPRDSLGASWRQHLKERDA